MKKNMSEDKKPTKKRIIVVYIVLRFLVILSMVGQIINRDWNNVFLCVLTLILFMVPYFLDKKLNISLPNALETTIILFIFSAEILGEIQNFYGTFKNWDTILHVINGFLCSAIGFSLVDILNKAPRFHITLSPVFVALVAFCFSMTVGVLWEFFEFQMDYFAKTDMQKDEIVSSIHTVYLDPTNSNIPVPIENINHTDIYYSNQGNSDVVTIQGGYLDIGIVDTMQDLFVNFIGALVFSIIGFLYIKGRDKYNFAENFIPTMKTE